MKISLQRIDSKGLVVDLPGKTQERIAIREATGLSGLLEQNGDLLSLTKGAAEKIALEALRILLGGVVLSSAKGATLEALAIAFEQRGTHLSIDLRAAAIIASDLGVATGDVVLSGAVTLRGAHLLVKDDEGSLSAERVELSAFSLRIGDLQLASPAVTGRAVKIRWGPAPFSLVAAALDAAALDLVSGDVRLAITNVHVETLAVDGPKISAAHATAERGRVAVAIPPSPPAPAAPDTRPSAEPFFDFRALDGLFGEIDVDVEVDLTVPIIGHRKATHRLRVPIADGSLDYRALENNLSALENALIDFSVRDGKLRLERVNPLFPARGHGKPIVVWDLEPADLVLAEHERVRLPVLLKARLAESGSIPPPSDEAPKKSSISLQRLALHRIDVRVALAQVPGELIGQLRPNSLGSLVLQGSVDHAPSDLPPPGSVLGELTALSAKIVDMPLGASDLRIGNVALASASPIEVAFSDITPTNVQVDLAGVALDDVSLVPRATT